MVTVSEVAVAAVTRPAAPRLRTTVLLEGDEASKPVPVIVTFAEFLGMLVAVSVTVALETIVATWIAAPLETPKDVTMADRLPLPFGLVVKVSDSDVVVAA